MHLNTTAPLGFMETIRTTMTRVFDAEDAVPDAQGAYVAL